METKNTIIMSFGDRILKYNLLCGKNVYRIQITKSQRCCRNQLTATISSTVYCLLLLIGVQFNMESVPESGNVKQTFTFFAIWLNSISCLGIFLNLEIQDEGILQQQRQIEKEVCLC